MITTEDNGYHLKNNARQDIKVSPEGTSSNVEEIVLGQMKCHFSPENCVDWK